MQSWWSTDVTPKLYSYILLGPARAELHNSLIDMDSVNHKAEVITVIDCSEAMRKVWPKM